MDVHIASNKQSHALPRGFSVYQPTLGAQLQFFPAIGTKELDEMLHAYLPGPASIVDKRAAVSVDFLEHIHLTGQSFKFYQVDALLAPAASATSSPDSSSATSSFPATPTWDFTPIAYSSVSTPSQSSSTSALKARKAAKAASASRQQSTDFSHLPGMKIMTRDGVDVTNAASRGCKTKEQRDHAHLMRIIKACDACRAKKIRCDPSHKRRAAPTAPSTTPQSLPPSNHRSKKRKAVSNTAPPAEVEPQSSSLALLAPLDEFSWDNFEASVGQTDTFDHLTAFNDPWTEFIHFPEPASLTELEGFFLNSQDDRSQSSSFTKTTTSTPAMMTPSRSSAHALASDAFVTANHSITSSTSCASGGYEDWSREQSHAVVTDLDSSSPVHGTMGAPSGLQHSAHAGWSMPPPDQASDSMLLSFTGTMSPLHRLEDPGTQSEDLLSPRQSVGALLRSDTSVLGASDADSLCNSQYEASNSQDVVGRPTVVLPLVPVTTVHDPARTLYREASESVPSAEALTASSIRSQPSASIRGRGGILALLPMSGPVVPGLAHLMLGGTSELIAASPPLSSRSALAMLCAATIAIATSFVASMARMLESHHQQARRQVSLLRISVEDPMQKTRQLCKSGTTMHPCTLSAVRLVSGAC